MTIKKWNPDAKEYEPHEVPDDWKLPLYSNNMDELINCVHCGKTITFGDGYTSQRYHTDSGYGYYECNACYFAYVKERIHKGHL